jgi:hypothetical protein
MGNRQKEAWCSLYIQLEWLHRGRSGGSERLVGFYTYLTKPLSTYGRFTRSELKKLENSCHHGCLSDSSI